MLRTIAKKMALIIPPINDLYAEVQALVRLNVVRSESLVMKHYMA
jgi:hypothetical protein